MTKQKSKSSESSTEQETGVYQRKDEMMNVTLLKEEKDTILHEGYIISSSCSQAVLNI